MAGEDGENSNAGQNSISIRLPKSLVISGENMDKTWKRWRQQFDWWSTATDFNSKSDEKKVATFMTCIGMDAIDIFESFELSEAEKLNLEVIKTKFTNYFTPTKSVTFERFIFNGIAQDEGEKVLEFIARIKIQADKCDFGALKDELVRDRIVVGIRDKKVQKTLLVEENLTLMKTESICRVSEETESHIRDLNKEESYVVDAFDKNKAKRATPKYANQQNNPKEYDCKRCGTRHVFRNCPAFRKKCDNCGRKGHTTELCRVKEVHAVAEGQDSSSSEEFLHIIGLESDSRKRINAISSKMGSDEWKQDVLINDVKITMKLDTGAECNVLPMHICEKLKLKVGTSNTKSLVSYSDHKIPVTGEVTTQCRIRGMERKITFKVIEGRFLPILGRKSCEAAKLIQRVHTIADEDIFSGLGCLLGYEYEIDFIANPSFDIKPARRIPHAIKNQVKAELDSMVASGVIIKQEQPTPVVSPMIVVKKEDKIRLCMDPSNLNANILRRHYPLKTIEEICANVFGSKFFTLLDCKRGFWQIKVATTSQQYLTFSTPWGRYSYCRMPFGICSAPEIFQKIMTDILQGVDGVEVSMDDILIYSKDKTQHEEVTQLVMKKLKTAGLKLNREKCVFASKRVKFLGHILTDEGLEPDDEKIHAIRSLKKPMDKQQLSRLLGMVNYLGKFIKNLTDLTDPLRELIKTKNSWNWTPVQDAAFAKIKEALSNAPVLRFYDVNDDVTLQVDASSKAMGAVLMQQNQPVAYAAKAFTTSQTNYPQIEKEASALRFACTKFHEYIYGKQLLIETDHKPLVSIFKKNLEDAPARLRRIMLDVMVYHPKITYKKGTELNIADTLSRDCELKIDRNEKEELEVLVILDMTETVQKELLHETKLDDELQELQKLILHGWPDEIHEVSKRMKKYWNFREELACYDGFLFKGDRIIMPRSRINYALKMAHVGHNGVQNAIRRARQSMYWYNMTNEIANFIQECSICQHSQRDNTKQPVITKPVPTAPFEIIATDLFYFAGSNYILIVDSYSGFYDFKKMTDTTSIAAITYLKEWFSIHGIPKELHSDNGPQYASAPFRAFSKQWNFRHITSSPGYPQSNGLAERYVQTAKGLLKKCRKDDTDVQLALLMSRSTPTENLPAPCERLFNRKIRTPITITKSSSTINNRQITKQIQLNRSKQKTYADIHTKPLKPFSPNDNVLIQEGHRKWFSGQIIGQHESPRSYMVRNNDGTILRRNSKHLRHSDATVPKTINDPLIRISDQHYDDEPTPTYDHTLTSSPSIDQAQSITASAKSNKAPTPRTSTNNDSYSNTRCFTTPITTRAGRVVKPVVRLDL
jgi:transposase InsO family protein